MIIKTINCLCCKKIFVAYLINRKKVKNFIFMIKNNNFKMPVFLTSYTSGNDSDVTPVPTRSRIFRDRNNYNESPLKTIKVYLKEN